MGNICSTRDESDMREQQAAANGAASGTSPKTLGGKNQKNVFKANPKGECINFSHSIYRSWAGIRHWKQDVDRISGIRKYLENTVEGRWQLCITECSESWVFRRGLRWRCSTNSWRNRPTLIKPRLWSAQHIGLRGDIQTLDTYSSKHK